MGADPDFSDELLMVGCTDAAPAVPISPNASCMGKEVSLDTFAGDASQRCYGMSESIPGFAPQNPGMDALWGSGV